MGKSILVLVIGLVIGGLLAWWWAGRSPRTLAQPSERLVAWAEVTAAEELPTGGASTWIVGATVHLRNITATPATVTVPAQRFLVVLGDGSTITGRMDEQTTSRIGPQQTASIALPKVSFVSRSQDAASVLLGLDEGTGLALVAAPVGDAPPKSEAAKPEPAPEAKPEAAK
jgi:hypothetical protein